MKVKNTGQLYPFFIIPLSIQLSQTGLQVLMKGNYLFQACRRQSLVPSGVSAKIEIQKPTQCGEHDSKEYEVSLTSSCTSWKPGSSLRCQLWASVFMTDDLCHWPCFRCRAAWQFLKVTCPGLSELGHQNNALFLKTSPLGFFLYKGSAHWPWLLWVRYSRVISKRGQR